VPSVAAPAAAVVAVVVAALLCGAAAALNSTALSAASISFAFNLLDCACGVQAETQQAVVYVCMCELPVVRAAAHSLRVQGTVRDAKL
jgi:hypothetical protein